MNIPYEIAQEYADIVRATFMVESGENPDWAEGDGGQAWGMGQQHPAWFKDYYGRSTRFPASVADTWTEAQIKAIASYYDVWEAIPRDLLIQAYRLGLDAVLKEGKRDPDRLAKIYAALNKIRAQRQA